MEGFTKWPIKKLNFSYLLQKSKQFQLLKVEKMNQISWVCLNPHCIQPKSRIFSSQNAHRQYAGCVRWIIDLIELQQIFTVKEDFQIGKKICLGQKKDVIQIMKLSMNIALIDWKELISNLKASLICKVNEVLQLIEGSIDSITKKVKFEDISSALILCNDIVQKKVQEKEISERLNYLSSKIINPLQFEDIQIEYPQTTQALSEMEQVMKGFYNNLIVKKNILEISSSVEQMKKKSDEDFRKFMLQQNINFNKVQQIASFCHRKCEDFIVRSRSISLQCPLCPHSVQTKALINQALHEIKAKKKQLSQQILKHCFQNHYQQIYLKYLQKKPKMLLKSKMKQKYCYEVSYKTVISDLLSGRYKKLHLIDRQTGIMSNAKKEIENNDIYYLQILTRHNRNMAKGRYLLTDDRKSTQFMINYVQVEVCSLKRGISIQSIKVDTNSKDLNKLQSLISILEFKQMNQQQDKGLSIKTQTMKDNLDKYKVKIEDYQNMVDYSPNQQKGTERRQSQNNDEKHFQSQNQQENENLSNSSNAEPVIQDKKGYLKEQYIENDVRYHSLIKKQHKGQQF